MTNTNNISDQTIRIEIIAMVANMTAAYVSNHEVKPSELPGLMKHIHQSLKGLEGPTTSSLVSPAVPAVPIEDSIAPDYMVCLEDGKQLKMLKRIL